MSSIRFALYMLVLSGLGIQHAHAMAGTLKTPSVAMPEGTSVQLRTEPPRRLERAGLQVFERELHQREHDSAIRRLNRSLDRLISHLSNLEGIKVVVSFVNESAGPSWIISHNAWGDPAQIYIKVNVGAVGFKAEQLQLPIAPKQGLR